MTVGSAMAYLSAPIHTMKCIGLFKRLDSSTCAVIIYGNTYTISIENALILYHSNFVLGCLNLPKPFH